MLEVIDKGGGATATRSTPLLFVHGGAFHGGAWCWDDHFLDYFAERGYHALALNLRGGTVPARRLCRSTPVASSTMSRM